MFSTRRTVFFVRHGESVWNKGQGGFNVYEMMRQTDHHLSDEGRWQARSLSQRLTRITPESRAAPILAADAIFSSPLMRALETAIIGFGRVMTWPERRGEFVLMPNAHEKGNLGGMDSRSTKVGSEIVECALNELHEQEGEDGMLTEIFSKLKFDTSEVQDMWWYEGTSETLEQFRIRQEEFMSQLLYSAHHTIVVVGHSLFFQAILKKYVSENFRDKEPEFVHRMLTKKLSNCGVLRLELDPVAWPTPITNVELVLDSMFYNHGGWGSSCCNAPLPPENDNRAIADVQRVTG